MIPNTAHLFFLFVMNISCVSQLRQSTILVKVKDRGFQKEIASYTTSRKEKERKKSSSLIPLRK